MPWVSLQCVIVLLFPDYTHLLLDAMTKKIIDSIAQFGTYCTFFTNVHRSNRYEACNIFKQLVSVAKSKDHKQKALQTDKMEIKYIDGWLRMGLLPPP